MGELSVLDGGNGRQAGTGLPAVTAPPSPSEWEAMKQQASVIARSGLAPKAVSKPEQVLVIALKGRELSIPPMQALSHIHIVEGKPTLSAELMTALVRRAGHKIRVVEWTDEVCTLEGVRADDPGHPQRTSFTKADAQVAGLLSKSVWKSYRQAMLFARAVSKLCRALFSDILMGASYTPEELGAEVNEEGEVLSAPGLRPRDARTGGPGEPSETTTEASEPVEDAEVIEDAQARSLEHSQILDQLTQLEGRIPPQHRPDHGQLWRYAEAKYGNACAAVQRLESIIETLAEAANAPEDGPGPEPPIEEEEESPPDFEDMRGGARQTDPNAKAHKSQVDYLRSLCEELAGKAGVESLEKRVGKPLEQFTQGEAERYIDEYSPRES